MKNIKTGIIALIFVFLITGIFAEVSWSIDPAVTQFNTRGSFTCTVDENQMPWWIKGTEKISAMSSCWMENGVGSDGMPNPTCCPKDYTCMPTVSGMECIKGGDGGDIIPSGTATSCSEFKDKVTCTLYSSRTNFPEAIQNYIEERENPKIVQYIKDNIDSSYSKKDIIKFCHDAYHYEKGGKCTTVGNCGCIWDDKAGCKEFWSQNNECSGNNQGTTDDNWIYCETETQPIKNTCDEENGNIILSWTAVAKDKTGSLVANPPETCKAGKKTYECPVVADEDRPGTLVPFFGLWNLIIAGLMICGIYLFMKRK